MVRKSTKKKSTGKPSENALSKTATEQSPQTQTSMTAQIEQFAGKHVNVARISHSKYEFLFDMAFTWENTTVLVSRVLMGPNHAKHILHALKENVAKYEKAYGKIVMEKKK